ncbi:MAG TPA: ATP-binding protein [Fimbriiglobus sp.]|nr:ATP-binding protein [Fimbriiglobus sp.]
MTLRRRILLTLAPVFGLLAVLGIGGVTLLRNLGTRADVILRENYTSVLAMERLNEALERIDSSFQFALAGKEVEARANYGAQWEEYQRQLRVEQGNVTIHPQEGELVRELEQLTADYREQGDRFYARPPGHPARSGDYFGEIGRNGLHDRFRRIKTTSGAILRLNQERMESASREARATARWSLLMFSGVLAFAVLLAVYSGVRLVRRVVAPIEAVTAAAQAIGSGELHRTVPVYGHDEVARLAGAFNAMSDQVRRFRRSNLQQLLRAQETARAAIDSFPDPVMVLDPEGRVELANVAARKVFGVTPSGDSQREPAPWAPPDPLRGPVLDALRDQRPYLTDRFDQAVALRLDGADHYFLPEVRPIRDPDGNTLGAAVVLDDVTRFRLLDQLKGDFVATVSHELKTPLTSVRLAVHLLLEEAVGPLNPKQTELLLDARDNAERLLTLIEQLLALARLEDQREALHIGREPVGPLLQSAADAVASRAVDGRVELVVGDASSLPPAAADRTRLAHALNNLLCNALANTNAGGTVTLSAEAVGPHRVRLTVADTGVGIAPEHLPHVFERFYRVPGDARPTGTGLGLAIVREIATAHGGEVTAESEVGRGTAFHLTLPTWAGAAT